MAKKTTKKAAPKKAAKPKTEAGKEFVDVRITSSADQNKVAGSLNGRKFSIPVDGEFHPLDPAFLPALDHSGVEYELDQPAP